MTICALCLAAILACGSDAATALEEKGLERDASAWILPAEADARRALHEVGALDRKVKDARKNSARMAKNLEGLDREIETLTRRRREIGDRLPGLAGDPRRHNQAVATLNQIGVRLAELYEYKVNSDEPAAVERAMVAARQEYIQHLLDTRRLVDEAMRRYAVLAADPQVAAALDDLGRAEQRTFTLGPSRRFLRHVQRLERLESRIESDRITMRNQAGIWWVPVVFNRAVTKELIFDSGASLVTLPAGIAAEIGLTPSASDTRTRMKIADGSVVEATVMTIPLVRVGTFEAKNVPCVVMPPEYPDAPALLGGTFINRFGYKMDTGAGTLTLHRLDDGRDKR